MCKELFFEKKLAVYWPGIIEENGNVSISKIEDVIILETCTKESKANAISQFCWDD